MSEEIAQTNIYIIKEASKVNFEVQSSNIAELTSLLNKEISTLSKGTIGLYYKDLKTNEVININSNELFPPASTFKVYTALLALKSIEKGEFKINNSVTLSSGLYIPGSGTFYSQSDIGKSFSIQSIIEKMIKVSCNTAQSMLFARLGREKIENRLISDLGIGNTSLQKFYTTPQDMGVVFEKLYRYELLNQENTDYIINLLKQSSSHDRIRAGLPEGTISAIKGGTLAGTKNDVGIVYSVPGDYILSIYTKNAYEKEAVEKIQNLSKIIWDTRNSSL